MTRDDMIEYIGYHSGRFPNWASWFSRFPGRSDDPLKLTQKSILDGFEQVLAKVTINDARAATDAMLSGVMEEPRTPGDHVRELARHAKRQATKVNRSFHDGQETVRCLLCADMGIVVVYPSKSIKAAMSGNYGGRGTTGYAAAACTCSAGAVKLKWLPEFDPDKFLPIQDSPEGSGEWNRESYLEWEGDLLAAFGNKAHETAVTWTPEAGAYERITGQELAAGVDEKDDF